MTALIIGIVLVVGGVAFAAAPFLRRHTAAGEGPRPHGAAADPASAASGRAADAESGSATVPAGALPAPAGAPRARFAALPASLAAELEELELDLAMGKLSEGDYRTLRAGLERRAAKGATASPSAAAGRTPPSAGTVESIPAPPGDAPLELDAMAERLVREARQRAVSCATCGPRPEPGARHCSHCGRALGGCPSCGRELRVPGARFCDHCGAALATP
mgnify:CR=1 FL=1